jgi:undecaprenyl-diphosphatase
VRLDESVSILVNSFAHRSGAVDRIVIFISSNSLVGGALVLAVFYFVWFEEGPDNRPTLRKRDILLSTLLLGVPAVLMARVLAWNLPYRIRPIFSPELHLRQAYGFDPGSLLSWSSFPSDHAVLFFTLATGVSFANRKAGFLLYLHAIFFVSLSLIFLGIHYPSDILAGAVLGCGFGYLASWPSVQSLVRQPAARLQTFSAGLFHAGFFYLAYETANLYAEVRQTVVGAWQLLSVLANHSFR